MKLSLAVTGVLLLCVGTYANPMERVLAGEVPTRSLHAALILSATDTTPLVAFGEGSIISKRHVLTAAHLVHTYNKWYISYGNVDPSIGRQIKATTAMSHPKYNPETKIHDIAIIIVPGDRFINTLLGVPALIFDVNSQDYVQHGTRASVMGFGYTSPFSDSISDHLFSTRLQISTDCSAASDSQFCGLDPANQTNLCRGDSGAGMYLMKKIGNSTANCLIGVASVLPKNCDGKGVTVFTKISYYTKWIGDIIYV